MAAAPNIGRWKGFRFVVEPGLIRSFSGLQIRGSNETDSKKKGSQLYVAKKNMNPVEISMTVHLNAMTGCDVRREAINFVSYARSGAYDYFYVGDKKLVTCMLLLTEATVKEVEIAHNSTWVKADVQITMKQTGTGGTSVSSSGSSSKSSGSGGSYSSYGSQKQSVRTSSTTSSGGSTSGATSGTTSGTTSGSTSTQSLAQKVASGIKTAISTIGRIVSNARSYSAEKKTSAGAGQVRGYVRYTPESSLRA